MTSKNKTKILYIVAIFASFFIYWRLNKLGYIPPINYFFSQNKINFLQLDQRNNNLLNYDHNIEELVNAEIDKSQTTIVIDKSKYLLTLYYQNQPLKSYPIVLGTNPVGDKLKEGDRKTPEGIFKVRDLYPHPNWSKFIWLDYPNHDSWQKHLQAKKSGEIGKFAAIGSEIGIHGVPRNGNYMIEEGINWTWGCISLKNSDVDEIYSVIQTGTLIQINP